MAARCGGGRGGRRSGRQSRSEPFIPTVSPMSSTPRDLPGTPKGVMVRHDALANFLATMADRPGIAERDRVLALTSLSFDIAGLELFLPLTAGARIMLADRAAAHDPERLKAIAAAQGVTMIQATPSTWRMLVDSHDARDKRSLLPAGCRVLCGGEALAPDLARRLVAEAGCGMESLRPDGDDDLVGASSSRCAGRSSRARRPDRPYQPAHPRRRSESCSCWGCGRALHRRPWSGARVFGAVRD